LLDSANQERKSIEAEILESATQQISASHDATSHFGIVVGGTGWHIGVLGIVASRLASRHGRPVIVVGFDDQGRGRGSCRSIEGFDLLSGLASCRDHLTRFGGHALAAGLEVSRQRFDLFREAFLRACSDTLKGRDLGGGMSLDGWVTLQEVLDPAFAGVMSRLEPFGEGNPEPVWGVKNVQVIGSPARVGKAHLKFRVGMGAQTCEAIGFNLADRLPDFPEGPLDIAFMLRRNTYLGRTSPQLHLLDFRMASSPAT
ncbi:MAG: DHHA1 domain-containing protein, partial [bacterium]